MPSIPETFRFAVENETPETMPLNIMADLLGELCSLLGDGKYLHLSGIEHGSCAAVIRIDNDYKNLVAENIEKISSGNIPKNLRKNVFSINKILGDNNLRARLDRPWGENKHATLYTFPGIKKEEKKYYTNSEFFEIQGEIVSISKNSKNDVKTEILSPIYGRVKAAVPSASFKKVTKNLFKEVILYGIGMQSLSASGEGKVDSFMIQDVEELEDTPISSLLERPSSYFGEIPRDLAERIMNGRNEP
ncbi:hypothetical protein DTI93_02490 [Parasaccharibacter sp. TMW 2.1884]|uniref:hypothetical protein n=1 Tax=Parasaccharibacter sp. TMW 2.1884 TaxID=2267834 RepID=UPI001318244F|nr:hypothetical protein [Parasaccharibacter sp. TMW 2.1884]MCL1511271.1 hypothetical protein [Parasaccharibacter sp. TMW 2.1884]QGT75042.1 hypothetical protein GN304_04305 [Bombella sp. ESL0368]